MSARRSRSTRAAAAPRPSSSTTSPELPATSDAPGLREDRGRPASWRLLGGLEREADAVDAVALVRGGVVPLALEHVAEVGAAVGAAHLDALHAERAVLDVLDAVLGQRREEGGPAAV